MEPHRDTTSNENAVDVEGNERVRSSSASSTSSKSSSEFQDPLQQNSFKKDNLPRKNSNEDQEKPEQEQRDSTLQSPPIQTMERPDNGSGYRIPSYVFARNKSGNPVEWSTTSNESLFSIHTGNTSSTSPTTTSAGPSPSPAPTPPLGPSLAESLLSAKGKRPRVQWSSEDDCLPPVKWQEKPATGGELTASGGLAAGEEAGD